MKKIHWLSLLAALAAFLLFQIELIIAKIFLPAFGGSFLVWGACVVFFQAALLSGYAYSHIAIKKLGISRYRRIHLLLILLPLLAFPGRALPAVSPHAGAAVVLDIFGLLLLTIGPVFFVLSTTSIISQAWLAASNLPGRSNPYVLYAASNFGSILALLSYPVFFELCFDLNTQIIIWRSCYAVLLALHFIVFRQVGMAPEKAQPAGNGPEKITEKRKISWFFLGAAGVIGFLSVTDIITYEITPAPLLWVIPLSIYLISFVLNFKSSPWCPGWIRKKFHLTAAFGVLLFFLVKRALFPFALCMAAYYTILFSLCMFCQHRLSADRPATTGGLTLFYLVIAAGSVFGGILVSWVMPKVSGFSAEFPVSFLAVYLALSVSGVKERIGSRSLRMTAYILLFLILWPAVFREYNIFGLIMIIAFFAAAYNALKANHRAVFACLFAVLAAMPFIEPAWRTNRDLYRHRNYYGIYRVFARYPLLYFCHGSTIQGTQLLAGPAEKMPTAYFHIRTPAGGIMRSDLFELNNIGVIGLGAGTLAAYGTEGQVFDFFELDPDIFFIADKLFGYLKSSGAEINHYFGDARISLGGMPAKGYDIIIVDVFSGDSIPAHLLTVEAAREYKRHLSDDGVILFHITNRYVDLAPVLFSTGRAVGAYIGFNSNEGKGDIFLASTWGAFTWSEDSFRKLTGELNWRQPRGVRETRPWTDLYSNILPVLKIRKLLGPVVSCRPFRW